MTEPNDLIDSLLLKIKTLNSTIWEDRVTFPNVQEWLRNFKDDVLEKQNDRLHALYLLTRFQYFGRKEVREMVRALYRDHVKYPIVEDVRKNNGDTLNSKLLNQRYKRELQNTRFLGMGNPSESGTHLLYFFRQENGLPRSCFIHAHEIIKIDIARARKRAILRYPTVRRYIFIDDLAATGTQAMSYSQDTVQQMKSLDEKLQIEYLVLFATQKALHTIRGESLFDRVGAVLELDESFRAFSPESRYFNGQHKDIDKANSEKVAFHYGAKIYSHPLGYKNSQLLLGMAHNTPNNTLPIFWSLGKRRSPWYPVFFRYEKRG